MAYHLLATVKWPQKKGNALLDGMKNDDGHHPFICTLKFNAINTSHFIV